MLRPSPAQRALNPPVGLRVPTSPSNPTCTQVCPWPQAALTALTNAAVFGATLALQAELKGRAPRCNELRICTVVRRDSEKENPTLPGMPAVPSSAVAALAVGLAAGQQRDQVVRATVEPLQG